jgi:hypothetical protein
LLGIEFILRSFATKDLTCWHAEPFGEILRFAQQYTPEA